MPEPFTHTPVLVDRVVDLLATVAPGTFVDLTLGAGGHARAVLTANPELRLLGLDRDPDALAAAAEHLAPFGDRVQLRHARSDALDTVLAQIGTDDVVAVLADLGVSSPQLDRAERGFSYRVDRDGPLDMRMDPTTGTTAADIVNGADAAELVRILSDYGDERFAARIAAAVVAARPVRSTSELSALVRAAIPAATRRRGGHPAKRTFQALRVAVNDELTVLAATLDQAIEALAPGGRLAVVAYHSGEDRIVKARLRTAADGGCTCPPGLPCACGARPVARLLRRGAWTPVAAEMAANPRAESARLRAIEKL